MQNGMEIDWWFNAKELAKTGIIPHASEYQLRKKNKSLKFKLDLADAQIEQMQDNKKAYQETVLELQIMRSKYNDLRKKLSNSNGNDLSDILNGLWNY